MKIGVYCRVSGSSQKENTSLENQRLLGVEFCKHNNYEYKVFTDVESGTIFKRKEFTKLLNECREGKLNGIWVYDNDRLGRDVDVSGDKFLSDQQKMAIWITNTRKSKFPLIKRAQNALQGIIDIEFDGDKKYKGVAGKKYQPSTTIPLSEAEGQLPPEINKEPEIPSKIKSLQGNTTALWKYILGDKAIGSIIDTQVASEFDKNIKAFLEQLDLMYGKSGTRGDVNFRYRKNPNYQGGKYADIPTTWNKKITGEPEEKSPEVIDWSKATDKELEAIGAKRYKKGGEDILIPPPNGWPQPGQSQEVLPYVQSYTGDYVQGFDNPLVGSANPEDLQEEIKRIKKLLL